MIEIVGDGSGFHHVDAATFAVESYLAVNECEECVIFAATDTHTGMHFGATLTNDDIAGNDSLTSELFHAEALAAGVAAVLDGALSFLMCHVLGGVRIEIRYEFNWVDG